jgi:hypothetical protein
VFLGVGSLVNVSSWDRSWFGLAQLDLKSGEVTLSFVSAIFSLFSEESFKVVQLMKSFNFDFGNFNNKNQF